MIELKWIRTQKALILNVHGIEYGQSIQNMHVCVYDICRAINNRYKNNQK